MYAIVLAAGKGTRLEPLTSLRPKPILELAGTSILLRIVNELLAVDQIRKIKVVIHSFADLVKNHLEEHLSTEEFQKITFVFQDEPKGTGHAVQCALDPNDEDFVVVYGDVIFKKGFVRSAISTQMKDEKIKNLLVGAKPKNLKNFGVVTSKDGLMTSLIEKPSNHAEEIGSETTSVAVNAGCYQFESRFAKFVRDIPVSERGEIELTSAISAFVDQGGKINVRLCEGEWFDAGTPWSLLNANEYLMETEQENYQLLGTIEPNVQVKGKIHVAKTARIRSGVYIEGPAYFDEGADIGPNCYIRGKSYFGKNSKVGNACEIKNSIIYSGTHAAHLSYVGDSILGERCNFGAGTITANLRHDNQSVVMRVKGEKQDTGRRKLGTVIGDNTKTGIGVNILPGVKIAANSRINAGELVNRDIK